MNSFSLRMNEGFPLKALLLSVLMVMTAFLSEWARPTFRLADHKPRILLEQQVPARFGDWRVDTTMVPVLPDPGLEAMLNSLYSQTLARTYVNSAGERVMLSIAYGSDQSSEATAVHRPEFCYSAQGFRVDDVGTATITIGGDPLIARRLVARLGQRIEPITYWITLDESATLPGLGRKIQQMRYGIRGQIADGMLVRVSTISSSPESSFSIQQSFLRDMYTAVPSDVRRRYFGG